jgi:predicted P-loop ATPase
VYRRRDLFEKKALAGRSRFPDLTKDGAPRPTLPNTKVAMEALGIECRYDLFKLQHSVHGHVIGNFAGGISDLALFAIRERIHERFRFDPPTNTVKEAVYTLANHHHHHPVRDYLDSLHWDGVPRIDRWLTAYGGAEDTPYVRAVSGIILVAAVRRIRQPGCKFDELLVLESEQGTNKSQALQVLAVRPEWFSDYAALGLHGREAIEQTAGIWIVEIAELRGMRSDLDKRKASLSRRVDRGRLAYGYTVTEAPRQFIPIGTTNDAQYLDDQTGAHAEEPADQ